MSSNSSNRTGQAQPPTGYLVVGIYIQNCVEGVAHRPFFHFHAIHMAVQELRDQLQEVHEVMDVLAELPGKLKHDIMVQVGEHLRSHASPCVFTRCLLASTHSFLGTYTTPTRCYCVWATPVGAPTTHILRQPRPHTLAECWMLARPTLVRAACG